MNRILSLFLTLVTALPAEAQIRTRFPVSERPGWWFSLGTGLHSGNGITDGETASTWDFGAGTNWQWRASLERAMGTETSVGATATFVRVPITYIGNTGPESCVRCDARLDLGSLGVSFHAGGGPGLHQILEASAGVAQYRNFRRTADDAPLAPTGGNIDPFFTFGYGFGYEFNSRMQVSVVQDYGLVLHERKDLPSGASNTLTQRTTRLNVRMGFGNRVRR